MSDEGGSLLPQAPLGRYMAGIIRLHELQLAGLRDGPEGGAVDDDLESPWNAMTETEQGIANKFSGDLYDLWPGAE